MCVGGGGGMCCETDYVLGSIVTMASRISEWDPIREYVVDRYDYIAILLINQWGSAIHVTVTDSTHTNCLINEHLASDGLLIAPAHKGAASRSGWANMWRSRGIALSAIWRCTLVTTVSRDRIIQLDKL